MIKTTNGELQANKMNILNLPEFEVLDTIQDDHDMTVIVKPVKEPVACPECGGVEYYKHGSYQFEPSDAQGNVVFRSNGTIHEFIPNQKITRTFEMENTPFPVQLEYLEFEKLTDTTSKLTMHVIYKSVAVRNQILQLPFAQGINMAHNRLQEVVSNLK